jgi:glycosyltransferase involved in cell wall biosynthesis
MRILALEPYYGGSHRAFLDGWCRHSQHHWTLLQLPAHKWKWRMRQSPLLFAWQAEDELAEGPDFDLVFCSDMLPLAEFLGLAPAALRELPSVVYFHENQLTYPLRFEKERDYHFGLSNIASALAADAVWFNSAFHRDAFLDALPTFLARLPDHRPLAAATKIRAKSHVHHPGIELRPRKSPREKRDPGPLHILWAARWEHDKDPETFFQAIDRLHRYGAGFQLSVLGEHFREWPAVFDEARQRYSDRILNWGFVANRSEYESVLYQADVFVSTACHEFFGLSAAEAIAAGALPLLPRRLTYPELLALEQDATRERFFYDGSATDLADRLQAHCRAAAAGELPSASEATELIARFHWSSIAPGLDRALDQARRC